MKAENESPEPAKTESAPAKAEPEPFTPSAAKKKILRILQQGTVTFGKRDSHARLEMKKDDLDNGDALNVLRGGVVQPGELRDGTWRYQVRTSRMCFVVAFNSATELVIVTAWRFKS